MGQGKDKSARTKGAGKKAAAGRGKGKASSPAASSRVAPKDLSARAQDPGSPATPATGKGKRSGTQGSATPPAMPVPATPVDKQTAQALHAGPSSAPLARAPEHGSSDATPTGPSLSADAASGDRRRWPERQGPATTYGEARRATAESRGEGGEAPTRASKLVPTNAVHPTERRTKRHTHQNRLFLAAAAAVLLGVIILTNQSEPPDLGLSERQTAFRLPAIQDWPPEGAADTTPSATPGGSDSTASDTAALTMPEHRPSTARAPEFPLTVSTEAKDGTLSRREIVEMERILVRLELAGDAPDGVIDTGTMEAIRLYQQIAGLPVDGEASLSLLTDMREVVQILDGN